MSVSDPAILAFDTSGAWCAGALLRGQTVLASRIEPMQRGQAERLFPLLIEILAENALDWPDLAALAVGRGPGNFTGIRISVAAARGLSLSLGIPAIGVTGFEALRGPGGLTDPASEIVSLPASRRGMDVMGQLFTSAQPAGDPFELSLSDDAPLPSLTGLAGAPRIRGYLASPLASRLGWPQTATVEASFGDSEDMRLVNRIGLVAAQRLASGETAGRPSPLYIRPADAAPPRDLPPVILP